MKTLSSFATIILLLLAVSFTAQAQGTLKGDVNGDYMVNIADINCAINIILGGNGNNAAADVNDDNAVNIADVNAIISIILNPKEDGHEYVNLGLPSGTLWATHNVGASRPEDYGDYFAWGETSPKDAYLWENYKWMLFDDDWNLILTKYNSYSGYGTVDNKTELEAIDDAATACWGPSWKMPYHRQQQELIDECTWTWTTLNGVNGYQITGPNGNAIFLPAAGFRQDTTLAVGQRGYYWSCQNAPSSNSDYAYLQYFSYGDGFLDDIFYSYNQSRTYGCTVRAVRVLPLYIRQWDLNLGDVPIGETSTGELTILNNTAQDKTLTVTIDEPFMLKQENGSASSITVVIPANSSSSVTVMFTATTLGPFTGNVIFQAPEFSGGQRVIPIKARAYTEDVFQGEHVDLGLPSGTLWATCNVGANSPEEYGDYFAWGETAPKEVYNWITYKWSYSNSNGRICLSRYNCGDFEGTVDNKTELDSIDDAAFVNWGPEWRTPTIEQLQELRNQCTWRKTTMNGVNGYFGIGPNGHAIFFPAAGIRQYDSLDVAGKICLYWSRTLTSNNYGYSSSYAYCTNFEATYVSSPRYYGCSVRAVRVANNQCGD